MIKTWKIEFSFHKFRDILGPFSQLNISSKWHFLEINLLFWPDISPSTFSTGFESSDIEASGKIEAEN